MLMKLQQFLETYYEGYQLVPGFYHKWHQAIHINSPYDSTNEGTYRLIADVQSFLFDNQDELLIVANSYPRFKNKTTYPNLFKRSMKSHEKKYELQLTNFEWLLDEDGISVQQITWSCKASEIKLTWLLKALANKDFLSLRPQLNRKNSVYAPDVFIINQRTNCIVQVYDDRGIEVMSADKEYHQYILSYFNSYNI